jgi:hypothetical protein
VREPKPAWVAALKAACGSDHDLRWNEQANRWEFIIPGADGVPRSQFWGRFDLPVDPTTGLHPFRDLDDAGMQEAIANLERTFIGNRFDGEGTTRKAVLGRYRYNRERLRMKYQQAGEMFADMAMERGRRLRGAPLITVPVTIGGRGQREERAG